jgi:predicted Zn-dependent protease
MKALVIAPATAGLMLAAACGKDAPRPAGAGEPRSETVVAVVEPGAPERPAAGPVVIGPVTFESAEATFAERRYEEAIAQFAAYTGSHPENPWGFYMLGLSAWKAGNATRAEEALRRAIALDSTHVKSRLNLGRVLIESGRPDDALVELEAAIGLEPTRGETYRLIGRAHDERDDVEAAIEAYRRAIVLDSTDVWAMNNLGVLFVQLDRHEEALGPLARATELRPTSPVFQNNLGSALERTGHLTAAATAYGAALAADSTYEKARVSLERTVELARADTDVPVSVEELARQFVLLVEQWKEGFGG